MRTQMILVPVTCLAMAGGSSARGQSTASPAVAEQLFQEARILMKQGDFQAACPKLEASFTLDPALGTQLNLAACYEHIDRLASAWEHYRAVADRATQAGQESRVEKARARAAAVEPRVPRLVVRVPDAAEMPGLVVMRGDTTLAAALYDRPIYVDAGEHHVHATAPGRQPLALAVRVSTGEERVVEVPLLAPVPAPVHVSDQPAPPGTPGRPPMDLGHGDADASPAGNTRRTLAWMTGGTGAATLAVGLALGWTAKQAWTDGGVPVCDPETWICDDDEAFARLENARTRARAANIAVGGGIALMAAGAVLYWTSRETGEDARRARVVPTAAPSELGVAVMGRF